MDIKHINNALTGRPQADNARKVDERLRSDSAVDTPRAESRQEDVTVGKGVTQLAALMEQVDSTPVTREEKINRIKEAIDNGTYQVNSESVARKLMQTEALFSKL